MATVRTVIALSVAALATACASPGTVTAPPSSPLPAADRSGQATQAGTSVPMATMEPRMKAMHEMHHQMMAQRMDSMQMMMDMMMQRMPNPAAAGK